MLLQKEIDRGDNIGQHPPHNFEDIANISMVVWIWFSSNAGIKELLVSLGITVFTESFNK